MFPSLETEYPLKQIFNQLHSQTASLSSSTQMQTSAAVSCRFLWHLTKDLRECCSSAIWPQFWSLPALQCQCWMLSEWERGEYNGEEVKIRRQHTLKRQARLCQMFSSETGYGCVRPSPPQLSAPAQVNRTLPRGEVWGTTLEAHLRAWSQSWRWIFTSQARLTCSSLSTCSATSRALSHWGFLQEISQSPTVPLEYRQHKLAVSSAGSHCSCSNPACPAWFSSLCSTVF